MQHTHAAAFRVAGQPDSSNKLVRTLRRLIRSDRVTVIDLAHDRGLGPALALAALQLEKHAAEAPTLFVHPHHDVPDDHATMTWFAKAHQRLIADRDRIMFADGLVFARPRSLAAVCAARVPWLFRLLQFATEESGDECARSVEQALRGLAPEIANAAAASWIISDEVFTR